jgi:hypothetical protein
MPDQKPTATTVLAETRTIASRLADPSQPAEETEAFAAALERVIMHSGPAVRRRLRRQWPGTGDAA